MQGRWGTHRIFVNVIKMYAVIAGAPNGSFRRSICSTGPFNRLGNSDLIAVKTRDFLSAKSPQTFVTGGLINSYRFGGTNMSLRV